MGCADQIGRWVSGWVVNHLEIKAVKSPKPDIKNTTDIFLSVQVQQFSLTGQKQIISIQKTL